jgi:hypothetical protein
MKKYSTKKYRNKRRNGKKYKKSQKNGKTRRYKVSKNINRQYSLGKGKGKGKGIRRHMSGGISFYNFRTAPFAFNIDPIKLKDYINDKYFTDHDKLDGSKLFTRLDPVAKGKVAITNTSLGFWLRKDNRYEQISVFACYQDDTLICYVIARCISDYSCENSLKDYNSDKKDDRPSSGMEEKILFVKCRDVQKLNFTHLTADKKSDRYKAFKKFLATEGITEENIAQAGYHLFQFGTLNTDRYRSSSDPGDTYRVIILPIHNEGLDTFFNKQAKQPLDVEEDKRCTIQDIKFRKDTTGDAVGAGNLLAELLLPG